MSAEFSERMARFFQADRGAYSVITGDEFNKSQVTFVGPEQELAEGHFGRQLEERHGNIAEIAAAVRDPNLYYRLFPNGERIGLTTSYKTGKPNELRLYLRKAEFKPAPGNFWGIFTRNGEIWLCEFSNKMLKQIESGKFDELSNRNEILDDDSGDYQISLNEKPEKKLTTSGGYNRNNFLAREALVNAKFSCEIHSDFPVFISAATGKPYMEAHHLVPMSLQEGFEFSLDIAENICCLNPISHRMLHHAKFDTIESSLITLIRSRADLLEAMGLLERDILAMYDR